MKRNRFCAEYERQDSYDIVLLRNITFVTAYIALPNRR